MRIVSSLIAAATLSVLCEVAAFDVKVTCPQVFFASQPPVPKCSLGSTTVIGDALGLKRGALDAILNQLSGMLGSLQGGGSTISARDLLNYSAKSDYSDIKGGNDSTIGLVAEMMPVQRRIAALFNMVEAAGNSPRGMNALANLMLEGSMELPAALRDSLLSHNETCEEGSPCRMKENRPIVEQLPEMELDLADLPDLLTGFLTSRVVSRVLARAIGELRWQFTGTGYELTAPSPMFNLGAASCEAADLSFRHDFDPRWASCGYTSLLAAPCIEDAPIVCTQAMYTPTPDWGLCEKIYTDGKEAVPVSLALQPESQFLANKDATMAAEGHVYYFTWMANLAQSSWSSSQKLCGADPNPPQLVPGWDRVLEVWSAQEGSGLQVGMGGLPMAILSRKGSTVIPFSQDGTVTPAEEAEKPCEFMLSQRGTTGAFEWMINFSAQQVPITDVSVANAKAHSGYTRLAKSVMPLVVEWFLDNVFIDGGCTPAETVILVTGHSLGGALAQLYALDLAENFTPLGVRIEAVLFAPANSLNQVAADRLKELANIRSIVYSLDLIPEFPCANENGLPRCDSRDASVLHGTERDDPYATQINQISINHAELGAINPRFTDPSLLKIVVGPTGIEKFSFAVPPPLDFVAQHVCSYSCWASSKFCSANPLNYHMCSNCPAASLFSA